MLTVNRMLNRLSLEVSRQLKSGERAVSISAFMNYTAKEREARVVQQKLAKKRQQMSIPVKKSMSVRELADVMGKPSTHVFDCLAHLNYPMRSRRESYVLNDFDLIVKIVQLSGFRHKMSEEAKIDYETLIGEIDAREEAIIKRKAPVISELVRRPPVVTIMGHVDHGKTTLLDALRGSHLVEHEFGGITQHIGAFNVRLAASDSNTQRNITFLDTPGHAAFSTMRSRGAKVTDIVVLVVAAEDSIMAQTIESIEHAKASNCPIIVAINKIDKASEAQVAKVKQDLLSQNLIPEEMGGEVQVVPISALKKINLDRLKEEIWAKAEMLELSGDKKGKVEGYVIESTLDVHRGKLATVLVKRGTLKRGSFLVAGKSWCKVKFLLDENAVNLTEASLSQAVQVMGWKELPHSGEEVIEVDSEHKAKELVELREKKEALNKQKEDAEAIKAKREEHNQKYRAQIVERQEAGVLKFKKKPNSEWRTSENHSAAPNVSQYFNSFKINKTMKSQKLCFYLKPADCFSGHKR